VATVHSLVCWGGRTGKAVTLTIASPCVVTSTNHGLRDGTGLVFSTTGALPTGITAGTTYYTRYVAANTFHLYDTEAHAKDTASTTGRINTSGTQSGTHTAKSRLMLDYFDQYPGRWGDAGSERCYDGLHSWNTARSAASPTDVEVCELGQAFSDIQSTGLTVTVPAGATRIESRIDGLRTEAFHYGSLSAGYTANFKEAWGTLLMSSKINTFVDGFRVFDGDTGYVNTVGISSSASLCEFVNMIVGRAGGKYGQGIVTGQSNCRYTNCLSYGWWYGIHVTGYTSNPVITNCTSVANETGMSFYDTSSAIVLNCISVGNTTVNWKSGITGLYLASNNAGLAGEAWATDSNPQITIATTDFVSFPTDMRPALSTSPQVDSGVEYYGALGYDIADAERPNYNNGGTEAFDIGCYEYDHGYGDHPASTTVTFSGVHAGSEVRVYDASGNELAGVESSTANPELTWVLSAGDVRVVVVHLDYKIKDFQYTPVAGAVSLPVQQEADSWYSNP